MIYCGLIISHGTDIRSSEIIPDSNFHGAHMGPTWVLSAPGGLHVGPKNLAIRDVYGVWSFFLYISSLPPSCYHIALGGSQNQSSITNLS